MSGASGVISWVIFLALGGVAVVTAASMLVTMSMYRAGLALMASFVALAGVFILLDADLPAAIQIMMNVGGMMMMMLFMVMLMMDPGGEMMWGMKRSMRMRGLGALSMRAPSGPPPADDPPAHQQSGPSQQHDHEPKQQLAGDMADMRTDTANQHGSYDSNSNGMSMSMDMSAQQSNGDMQAQHGSGDSGGMDMGGMDMGQMTPRQNYDMMRDMAMTTTQLPWALVIGALTATALIALAALTPWPTTSTAPTQDASLAVGQLLLGPYMVGFEGAAFLIVGGIAGAVLLGRREGAPPAPMLAQEARAEDSHVEGDVDSHADGHEAHIAPTQYSCPMHPEVQSSTPGQCPKCGMNLIPMRRQGPPESQPSQQPEGAQP